MVSVINTLEKMAARKKRRHSPSLTLPVEKIRGGLLMGSWVG
jgi:hypothetical protein